MWNYVSIALIAWLAFGFLTSSIAYAGTKHIGLLFAGWTYGIGAVLIYKLDAWWPLLAVYATLWLLRLLGLDPGWKKR